jgi:hypothetical protein
MSPSGVGASASLSGQETSLVWEICAQLTRSVAIDEGSGGACDTSSRGPLHLHSGGWYLKGCSDIPCRSRNTLTRPNSPAISASRPSQAGGPLIASW